MQTVKERNHVQVVGNGSKTIVMAHGFGCDQKMWQAIVPFFKHYQIVLFDYVGSGQSDFEAYDEEKYNTLHGYKQDLLDVIAHLNLTDIYYIGHSVSSMIGMLAANEQPERFKKLIMIGPSPCYLKEDTYNGGFESQEIDELLSMMEMNFLGWASFMAPYALGEEKETKQTKALNQTFSNNNPEIARQFAEATFKSDHRLDLHKCVTKTFIIQSNDDAIVPVEIGQYIHERMPNSELKIIPIKGHYPHITAPQYTSELILNFIEEKQNA